MPPARLVLWLATLGVILFTAHSVLTGAPPMPVSISVAAAYFSIGLAGVLTLRLRMFVDAVIRGPKDARGVVLTFDDGPHPVHTRKILDLLDEHHAKAVFFVIGKKVTKHPDVVKEIVARGHEVGIHGYSHDRFLSLRGPWHVRADLTRAVAALENVTGQRPTLFRPPIGHTSIAIGQAVDRLELTVVGWSASGGDGVGFRKPTDVARKIAPALEDGTIVMLHDAPERGEREPAAVKALPAIFEAIAAKNLSVVQLSDWLEDTEGSSTTKRAPSA